MVYPLEKDAGSRTALSLVQRARTRSRKAEAEILKPTDRQKRLLVGAMYFDGVPFSTIEFMIKVFPVFFDEDLLNASQMGRLNGMTPQGAVRHVRRLEKFKYLTREHYRGYRLNEDHILSLNH